MTHGFGLALSVAGVVRLLVLSFLHGNGWHIVSCGVYGGTVVCLYASSTLYHSVGSPRLKRALKKLDHSSIYLLIAGTYTPFTLVVLRGHWGWALFGLIWGLSVLGILWKVWFVDRFKIMSTALYVVMGWLILLAIKPLLDLVPSGGILWLLAGGVAYTVGIGFYALRKLPYAHAIWHVFVLTGSICHYLAILYYVVPART